MHNRIHIPFTIRFLTIALFCWISISETTAYRAAAQAPVQKKSPLKKSPLNQPLLKKSTAEKTNENSINPTSSNQSIAEDGLNIILNRTFLPTDFDQETFDQIWKVWPKELREKAAAATAEVRREMAYSRYGLTFRNDGSQKPLQYVINDKGGWSLNCFACHGGKLDGKSYPGLPNTRIALESIYQDMKLLKPLIGKSLSEMDLGSALIPMGTSVGTSNAVIFGVALMNYRDKDLKIQQFRLPPIVTHHDMDAPPWWHFKKRKMLYIDGFTQKSHRALMPFTMVKQNTEKKFKSFEPDFEKIYQFIESVEPPEYPHPVDKELAQQGRTIFNANCADCHGTYGEKSTYREVVVDIDEIGTDRVRLDALTKGHRKRYGESWLTGYGREKYLTEPAGYVAPPLDGIWASAPYFHNGSVPSLWGVLNADQRPAIWKQVDDQDRFDKKKVGVKVKVLTKEDLKKARSLDHHSRRKIFSTFRKGKSNSGHRFPERLSQAEKKALLEYLKTL